MDFTQRYQYNVRTDLLGKGGFARVYRAHDTVLDREVAIKVFNSSDSNQGSVLTEIRKAIRYQHPNLISYYDVALLENTNAFGEAEKMEIGVMEFANSGDLKTFMRRNKDTQLLLKLLTDVLNGLQYLHEKGLIHRDLKPQNILLHKEGNKLTAKIADFGISKLLDDEGGSSSALLGSVEYMAPEQFNPGKYGIGGRISTNVDLWSFGVMLFELLTEQHLFGQRGGDNTAEQIMTRILALQLPPEVETLAEPYRRVIKQCLVADAKLRIQESNKLISLLQAPEAPPPPGPDAGPTEDLSNLRAASRDVDKTSVLNKPGALPGSAGPQIPSVGNRSAPSSSGPNNGNLGVEPGRTTPKRKPWVLPTLLGGVLALMALAYFNRPGGSVPTPLSYHEAMQLLRTDKAQAIAALRQAVDNGSDSASYTLAQFELENKQFGNAHSKLEKLAAANFPGAAGQLGLLYYRGNTTTSKPDYTRAEKYFKQAAEQNRDTAAYYYLSDLYANGRGKVAANLPKAFKYAKLAAEAGNVRGEANLGALYFNGGAGIARDPDKAFDWYNKAADDGNAYANYIVGYFYMQGIAVQKNLIAARRYMRQAASMGVPEAKKALNEAPLR